MTLFTLTAFKLFGDVTIRVNIFTNHMIPLLANITFNPIVVTNLQISWWCFLRILSGTPCN